MGALRTYKVTVEVEVEVRTDATSVKVHDQAIGKVAELFEGRETTFGSQPFANAVKSVSIYRED